MKNRYNYIFVLMLVSQIAFFVHIFNQKPDLFMDEYWTFNFANANYFPLLERISELFNTWQGKELWQKLLTVQMGEQFNYGAVYYNTAQDVHPPLYYFIIHTVCSFFPNTFSTWFGFFPNIFFFVLTQVLLYCLGKELWGASLQALIPCFIYGFSVGAIQTVTFIRMYMLLTFWCTLSFYLHWRLMQKWCRSSILGIALVHILAFLTQYYYVLFAASAYAAVVILLFRQHATKRICLFTASNILALGSAVLCFPVCLEQILGVGGGTNTYRGIEIWNNLENMQFFAHLRTYLSLLVKSESVMFFMLLGLVLSLPLHRLRTKNSSAEAAGVKFSKDKTFIWLASISLGLTFIIIVKISQLLRIRYLWMLLPILALFTYYLFSKEVCEKFNVRTSFVCQMVCAFTVVQLIVMGRSNINYALDTGINVAPQIIQECVEQKHVRQCINFNKSDEFGFLVYSLGVIKEMPQTYLLADPQIAQIKDLKLDDKILVMVYPSSEKFAEKILTYFKQNCGYRNVINYKKDNTLGWYYCLER